MALIECVPNVSEGRRKNVDALVQAIRRVPQQGRGHALRGAL
jgi:glutamate formiminotransferase